MKQKLSYLLVAAMCATQAIAQSQFYGVARNTTVSTEVFLANVNPTTGYVTNISTTSLGPSINLTGAALDPYNNYFHFMGGTNINTVSLSTGNMVSSVPIYNPIASSYFDNYRFNNSDTSLYGLARRVIYDSATMSSSGEVYLAKINLSTGLITQISPSSVGVGFSLGGSAIDPYQKIYYYTTGLKLVGLDMYTGNIWSSADMLITNGIMFDNIAYSCVDTAIYGLIRQNYYDTTYPDPLDSSIVDVLVDSTTIMLGRINPATGVVTTISPYSIASGGYSLNSGATIDPYNRLYYFNNGSQLIAVSLTTGLIVNQPTLTYSNGEYFELMRYMSNCAEATLPLRLPQTTGINSVQQSKEISVYPNPATDNIQLSGCDAYETLTVVDATGRVVFNTPISQPQFSINVATWARGIYLIKAHGAVGSYNTKVVIQ